MPADGGDHEPTGNRIRAALATAEARFEPFAHWLLQNALPAQLMADIAALPVPLPTTGPFDGRRESHNSTRLFFSPRLQARFPACRDLATAFADPATVAALEMLTGADLSSGRLRIEYCQDADGFWLEPHLDVSVKKITVLIHLSDDAALADAGTDLYGGPPLHRPAGRAPFGAGKGLGFVPGSGTWHGFPPRPIRAVRRSLIVNFVGPEWRALDELA